MGGLPPASGQKLEALSVSSDQSFFLRPAPTLHLPLGSDGVVNSIKLLRKDKAHGAAGGGEARMGSSIVL